MKLTFEIRFRKFKITNVLGSLGNGGLREDREGAGSRGFGLRALEGNSGVREAGRNRDLVLGLGRSGHIVDGRVDLGLDGVLDLYCLKFVKFYKLLMEFRFVRRNFDAKIFFYVLLNFYI